MWYSGTADAYMRCWTTARCSETTTSVIPLCSFQLRCCTVNKESLTCQYSRSSRLTGNFAIAAGLRIFEPCDFRTIQTEVALMQEVQMIQFVIIFDRILYKRCCIWTQTGDPQPARFCSTVGSSTEMYCPLIAYLCKKQASLR